MECIFCLMKVNINILSPQSLKHAIKKKKAILENFKAINHQVQSMKDDMFLTEALDLIIGKEN